MVKAGENPADRSPEVVAPFLLPRCALISPAVVYGENVVSKMNLLEGKGMERKKASGYPQELSNLLNR